MVEKNVLLCFVKIVIFSGVHLALNELYKKNNVIHDHNTRTKELLYSVFHLELKSSLL